jgi:hypothetical protein
MRAFLRLWLKVLTGLMVLAVVFRSNRARVHTVIEERENDARVHLGDAPNEPSAPLYPQAWVWAPIDA